MPKTLFYLGVICSMIAAAFAAAEVTNELMGEPFRFAMSLSPGSLYPVGGILALATLVFAIPIGALLVRMGSLLAARNLFESFVALLSTACATLGLLFFSTVQLRMAVALHRAGREAEVVDPGALASLAELNLIAFYTFGWFLSFALLTLRPYFVLRSSRTLAFLVCVPLPLYVALVAQQILSSMTNSAAYAPLSFAFFLTLTVIFAAIPVHSLRHRHLFLEPTNLRELLDARVDPSFGQRSGIAIRGGVAFDS